MYEELRECSGESVGVWTAKSLLSVVKVVDSRLCMPEREDDGAAVGSSASFSTCGILLRSTTPLSSSSYQLPLFLISVVNVDSGGCDMGRCS
jgi:hypothetical protein